MKTLEELVELRDRHFVMDEKMEVKQITEENRATPHFWIGEDALKHEVYAFCVGKYYTDEDLENGISFDEEFIYPMYLVVWDAFKKHDFDLDKFMSGKGYYLIPDADLREEVLMVICIPLSNQPIAKYWDDWMNGYLDFTWGTFSETEILVRLYYCSTDEDIWKMIAEGIGDAEILYKWYKGIDLSSSYEQSLGEPPVYGEKDEKKAAAFLEYLLNPNTEAIAKVQMQAMLLKKMGELYDKLEG